MKRILSLVLASLLCVTMLAGCGQSGSGAPSGDGNKSGDNIKIAVSLNSADTYRTSWITAFKALADEKGYTVIETNADSDPSAQISDIETLIAQEPDVLVVHPYDSESVTSATDKAFAQNIPVVLIDQSVASDNFTAHLMDRQGLNGVIQAEYVQKWLAEDPSREMNIGYIVGLYSMEAAMPRRDEFYQTLGIESAMAENEAGWSANNAMSITEDWLQAHPTMNIFACMSDEMAIGCIQALKAANKNMDDILVLGVDGSEAAMEYLKSGELDCTAARDVNKEVGAAMDTVEKIYRGETVDKEIEMNAIYPLTKDDVK